MRVLVTDDDPILRMLMRELLESKLGYHVIEATNGREAWQILDSQTPPDLCIIDVVMPEMNGLDLLAKIREDPRFRSQRVMLCSSVHKRSTVLQAAALGVSAFLIKPFRTDEFLQKVRQTNGHATAEALEPLQQVLERLAITKSLYFKLLAAFIRDLGDVVAQLLPLGSGSSQENLQIRLGAISGAASTLGAWAVVGAITGLERALAAGDRSAVRSAIEALSAQKELLVAVNDGLAREPGASALDAQTDLV